MFSISCPECSEKFSNRTALCDDWHDPEKSFGCPYCQTFYLKDREPNRMQSSKAGIIGGGILAPSSMMIGRYFSGGDIMFMVFGVIILASVIGVIVLDDYQKISDKLIKSPYKRGYKKTESRQ